jgi:hypothetical protein
MITSSYRWPSRCHSSNNNAFSRLDLLSVLVVLLLFVLLVLSALHKAKEKASKVTCIGNLVQLGIPLRLWAREHESEFPWQVTEANGGTRGVDQSVHRNVQLLSNVILNTKFIICPADNRQPSSSWEGLLDVNISYFLGLGAKCESQDSLLAGDRNIMVVTNALEQQGAHWNSQVGLHGSHGNLFFGDGHVGRLVDSQELNRIAEKPVNQTNRFLLP